MVEVRKIAYSDYTLLHRFYLLIRFILRPQHCFFYSQIDDRDIFDLKPGEKFFSTTFDDPRSSKSDLMAARSGRLYVIRFPDSINLESHFEAAKPGSFGMSLYTYRVRGLQNYCDRIKASSAQNLTNIVENEFGEKSFSFVAPDGYFWNLVEG